MFNHFEIRMRYGRWFGVVCLGARLFRFIRFLSCRLQGHGGLLNPISRWSNFAKEDHHGLMLVLFPQKQFQAPPSVAQPFRRHLRFPSHQQQWKERGSMKMSCLSVTGENPWQTKRSKPFWEGVQTSDARKNSHKEHELCATIENSSPVRWLLCLAK